MTIKFRKRALEELKSPEQLDQALKITSPLSWLLLIALVIVVVAAIIWGVYGSIATRVSGRGIYLTSENSLVDAVAYEYGKVAEVYVHDGQKVKKDDVLLKVSRADLDQRITQLEKEIVVLTQERSNVEKRIIEEIQSAKEYAKKQSDALQQDIDSRQKDLDYINSTIKKKELMAQQGYLTRDELESSYQKQREYTRDITDAKSSILQLQNDIYNIENDRKEHLDEVSRSLDEKKLELDRAKADLITTEIIKSPITGEVVNIRVNIGDEVQRGQPVVSVLQGSNVLSIIGFVPAEEEGRKITPGMRVLIEPAGVKREMYGAMMGSVSFVSNFPVPVERLVAILHNEDLAKKIALTMSLLEVRISLTKVKDPNTGQWQYQWTSQQGQQLLIKPGTLCRINVTVESQPPITLIIPALKKLVGVYY